MSKFKVLLLSWSAALLLLSGCSLPKPLLNQSDDAPEQKKIEPKPKSQTAPAQPPVSTRPKPDAVYRIETENRSLPKEVDESLQAIASRVKADKSLVIRLESFVPSGGSREMNVSRSNSAVSRIRKRLAELGVPSYRIQQAPLGEEHPDAQKLNTKWVELFVVPLPR